MKKIFGIGLATAAGVSLASCSDDTANLNVNFDTDHLLASSMYAIGGALESTETTNGTLTTMSTSTTNSDGTLDSLFSSSLTEDQYEQVSNSVTGYVDTVDKLMTGGLDTYFSDTTSITIEGIEDYSEVYELALSSGSYVVAYNLGESITETDDDEEETIANLSGKMYQVVDGEVTNTFDLVGFEASETDEDEVENKFFMKASDSEGNYIKYHYSNEVETEDGDVETEAKLKLKTSIDGVRTYNETEIETDSKGYEVEITEFVFDLTGISYQSEYYYYRSLDGEFDITYTYRGMDFSANGSVEVTEEDGTYTYTFVDESNNRHEFRKDDHRKKQDSRSNF